METLQVLDLPISREDFAQLEAIVRDREPFLIAPSNIADAYDLAEYCRAAAFDSVRLCVLLDNNVLTRAVAFAQGSPLSNSIETRRVERLVAAEMAFLLLSDFLVEPNIAFYEKAWRSSHEAALEQLRSFRIADHIHPQHYIDVALERTTRIPTTALREAEAAAAPIAESVNESNFSKTLDQWQLGYLFCLRAAELWRSPGRPIDKAMALLTWMRTDSFFSAVSAVFGLLLFSPSRPGKIFKGIGSDNAARVRDGAQNAAWDCVYLKHWTRRAAQSGRDHIWFLCTNDTAVKSVGSALFLYEDEEPEAALFRQLKRCWGHADAIRLFEHYQSETNRADTETVDREATVKERVARISEMVSELEKKLRIKEI